MPGFVKGILIFLFATAFGAAGALLLNSVLADPFLSLMQPVFNLIPIGFVGDLFTDVFKLLLFEPFQRNTAMIIGAAIGALYGIEAGILLAYNLASWFGWFQLLIDMTWSLPNTTFGLVLGNAIYPFFGSPSTGQSKDKGWISYSGSLGGGDVLQTLGTVNLGGAGKHEPVHLWQARLFGPFYLLIFGINYVVNFLLQVLWTFTIGGLLYLVGLLDTPYFRPGQNSAVGGAKSNRVAKFFGWMYFATVFELWAYGTE
jgi:hypothetical protein